MLLRPLFLVIFMFFCIGNAFAKGTDSPWQFEVGVSAGKPTPIMINAGVSKDNILFRVEGGGWHLGSNEFWVGYRGNLAWEFFHELPFSLDLGISGGYAFAKAPNEIHRALNRAGKRRYVRSYNYKETLDISIDVRPNIYGFFTQLAIPLHYFKKHNEPTVLWRVGYAYRF